MEEFVHLHHDTSFYVLDYMWLTDFNYLILV